MPKSLSLYDFSDREVLLALRDLSDKAEANKGWVSAESFAIAVGLTSDYPAQKVGSRFSWMRRYGVLEYSPNEITITDENGTVRNVGGWRLTASGHKFASGDLRSPQKRAIESLQNEQALSLGLEMGDVYHHLDYSGQMMMTRALRFKMGKLGRR